MIADTGISDRRRVSIDSVGEDLEMLIAACEAYRGPHDYKAVNES
jgi:hypothetical protein